MAHLVFIREASFWAWVPKSRPYYRTDKHAVKVNVWSCFIKQGSGVSRVFTGILNAQRMLTIYKRAFLKQ